MLRRSALLVFLLPLVVAAQREADDLARFLAGYPGNAGSSFAKLESTSAWQEHRRKLEIEWKEAEGLVRGLRDFQRDELSAKPMTDSAVFYPFGGPDALTPTLCFPRSPVYVIVGLEPAGTLPTADQLAKKDLAKYLGSFRVTLSSELHRSFFITSQMDREFRGQVTDGLLLPILHILVRTKHTILNVRYVRLDDNGNIVDRPLDYTSTAKFQNRGVEIEFRQDNDPLRQKLYYFAVNLADERLKENKAALAYFARLKGSTTLLKATSYATHRPDFSVIRDVMLNNSAAILQDDSGIPYRLFQPSQWQVLLYGGYDHPYGSFRGLVQADLRQAYRTANPKPLSFAIGYGFERIPSNLLLAKRTRAVELPSSGSGAER